MDDQIDIRATDALQHYRWGLDRFDGQGRAALHSGEMAGAEAIAWLAERVSYWQGQVAYWQEHVALASDALDVCHHSGVRDEDGNYHPPDCSAEEARLREAQAQLEYAEQQLGAALHWQAQVQNAFDAFRPAVAAVVDHLDRSTSSTIRLLDEHSQLAEAWQHNQPEVAGPPPELVPRSSIAATSGPGGGSASGGLADAAIHAAVMVTTIVGNGIGGAPAGGRSEGPAAGGGGSGSGGWTDRGVLEVPLELIDLRDSAVTSSVDYHKVSEDTMRDGLSRLERVIRPAVAAGHSAEYFRDLDASLGLSYERGYQCIFEAFYGTDAIRLNQIGTGYEVVNGYHRLRVAQQLGWQTVPARVIAQSGTARRGKGG